MINVLHKLHIVKASPVQRYDYVDTEMNKCGCIEKKMYKNSDHHIYLHLAENMNT